jgi:hypothetical protein
LLNGVIAGGTQVKWNRQDPHVLASSHLNEVLIWDRRVSLRALNMIVWILTETCNLAGIERFPANLTYQGTQRQNLRDRLVARETKRDCHLFTGQDY